MGLTAEWKDRGGKKSMNLKLELYKVLKLNSRKKTDKKIK